jgi:hypothetical protein
MNNNNDADLRRLRRDVSYAALPVKAGLGAAVVFGFLVLAMVVIFGLTIVYDLLGGQ